MNRTKALAYAIKMHEGQKRKYTGEPYINHCISVAESISVLVNNWEIIAAAVLHDTIEDTDATYLEVKEIFGMNVADIVLELTDKYTRKAYPNLNRKERKFLEACRLKDISQEAKLIKYFDIMDNSKTIFKYDKGFSKVYLKEKQFILGYSLADLEL